MSRLTEAFKSLTTKSHKVIGESSFMKILDNIGFGQKSIENLISTHVSNGVFYDKYIENKHIAKLQRNSDAKSSHWIYTLLVEDREDFKKYLADNKVSSDVVHIRNDKYSVFNQFRKEALPGADYFCERMINIPVGWWIGPQDAIYIVDLINAYRK